MLNGLLRDDDVTGDGVLELGLGARRTAEYVLAAVRVGDEEVVKLGIPLCRREAVTGIPCGDGQMST